LKVLYFLILFISSVWGREITLSEIESYPKGYARDFYIWQFLQQNISKDQKEKAYNLVYRSTWRIDKYFPERKNPCDVEISKKPKMCITPRFLSENSSGIAKYFMQKYFEKDEKIEYLTKSFYYKQSMAKTLYKYPEIYLDIFLGISPDKRKDIRIDTELSPNFLRGLQKDKKRFEKFVAIVLAYGHFYKIKKSFLKLEPSNNISGKALLRLAYFYIQKGLEDKAFQFFKVADEVAYYQEYKDEAKFWMFILSNDKKYLEQLVKSWDINIYTIYAHETLDKKIDGYLSGVDLAEKEEIDLDSSNPFQWQKFLHSISKNSSDEILKLAEKFKNKNQWEIYYYLMQRGNRYRVQSFPTELQKYMVGENIDLQAILLAISRQESRFIPSVISIAYALGSMQMMPFLVDDIAKNRGEKIEYEDMFQFKKSVEYSLHHLKDLKRSFDHPLLIAYAYNAGASYAKRVKRQKFKKGKYEPFLSLETLTYGETRKYGKKVLANYIIFKKLLGEDTSLHKVLEKL
jgi:soluble lytic murein transglycosylase